MKLIYAICLPNLTYTCEALNYTGAQFQPLNVAINVCLRKIFGCNNRRESAIYLRQLLGYPSLETPRIVGFFLLDLIIIIVLRIALLSESPKVKCHH